MLTLVTGQPGSAKTLWIVSEVDKLSRETGRPVYYNKKQDPDDPDSPGQLTILDHDKLPWIPFDDFSGFDWDKCPEGAIIVLDEGHRELFPTRQIGSKVPAHVDAMSTHRHRGHDVYISCQHSTQIDTFVRKMAGEHHHFVRRFGLSVSSHFMWMEWVNERDSFERKKAQTSMFRCPEYYFGAYKSTELNTVKTKWPKWRIAALLAGLAVIPLLLWAALAAVWPDRSVDPAVEARPVQNFAEAFELGGREDLVPRLRLYAADTWAREVPDIPYSATFYDHLIEPVSYPRVTGCARHTYSDGRDDCRCTTQQGTRAKVSYRVCIDIVENGIFDFSRPDPQPENLRDDDPAPAASPEGEAPGAAAIL